MDYIAGTRMTQAEYEELADCSFVDRFDCDEKAQIFISRNFGFEATKVEIVKLVKTFKETEKNGVKVIVPDKTFEREPLFASWDWNYLCFTVCGTQYEVVNGDIYIYED